MALAQAQALVPDLAVVDASPEADAVALGRLALWCLWCAPLVAPDPPDGVWIDVAGSAHLFGGEAALLKRLAARLRGGGCAVRFAVADTPGAAWAVARYAPRGTDPVVSPGGMATALAGLPVEALRLPADTVAALRELGLDRVAHLAALPRSVLGPRLGTHVLGRLDAALGHAHEALAWSEPPEIVAVRRAFPEPIAAPETLERVAGDLVARLVIDLAAGGLGARRIDLAVRRVDGGWRAVCVGTAAATRDPRHLRDLLRPRLPVLDPGFGIDEAVLSATVTEPLAAFQHAGLAAGPEAGPAPDLAVLVDRLAARVGHRRLYRAAPVESRIPERSTRRALPLAPAAGVSWPEGLDRPTFLIDPPEPVTALALMPDAPPAAFVWRGERHRVARADGPERVRGEWWVSQAEVASVRDYYRVETTEGGRYWLFRDAPMAEGPRWWLQGVFG